jgi:hypothetical protein
VLALILFYFDASGYSDDHEFNTAPNQILEGRASAFVVASRSINANSRQLSWSHVRCQGVFARLSSTNDISNPASSAARHAGPTKDSATEDSSLDWASSSGMQNATLLKAG